MMTLEVMTAPLRTSADPSPISASSLGMTLVTYGSNSLQTKVACSGLP